MSYLPKGLPEPVTETDKLDLPYWEGTRAGKLMIQRCGHCNTWQWGPEWICHECNSWNMKWVQVEGQGRIWTWTRCWHPVHSALKGFGPYIAVLVELPEYGNVRMIGNLLGDAGQAVTIGAAVEAVFEHHDAATPPFTLVHWRVVGGS